MAKYDMKSYEAIGEEGAISSAEVSTENTGYTKQEKLILGFIYCEIFLCGASLSLPAPFLPLLNEGHNVGTGLTGVIISFSPLCMIITSPFYGKLVSGRGTPRVLFIVGTLILAISSILFGLLEYYPLPDETDTSPDYLYFMVAALLRSIQAAGSAAMLTAAMAMVVSSFKQRATMLNSYIETSFGLGVMAGPALGSGFYALGGFALTFNGVGWIIVLAFLLMCCFFPAVESTNTIEGEPASYRLILTNVNIFFAMIFTAVTGLLWTSLSPVLEPELRIQYGLSEELCALTFLILSAGYVLTTALVAQAFQKWKDLDTLAIAFVGLLVAVVAFIFIGPTPLIPGLPRPLWLVMLCLALLGITFGCLMIPSLNLLMVNGNPLLMTDASKSLILGLWNCAISFGFPRSEDELSRISNAFRTKTGFPGIVGCVDGSYIPLGYLPHEDYINRKNTSSIILQAVCDHEMLFTSVYSGWPGRVHDSRVYRRSHLAQLVLPNLPQSYHILGDAAYPLTQSLLTPYKGRNLPADKELYNHIQSKNRITIERAFALLKCRWRKLRYANIDVARLPGLVTACCVLHNICVLEKDFMTYDFNPEAHVEALHGADNGLGIWKRDTIKDQLLRLANS